jgi:hypothetical protein
MQFIDLPTSLFGNGRVPAIAACFIANEADRYAFTTVRGSPRETLCVVIPISQVSEKIAVPQVLRQVTRCHNSTVMHGKVTKVCLAQHATNVTTDSSRSAIRNAQHFLLAGMYDGTYTSSSGSRCHYKHEVIFAGNNSHENGYDFTEWYLSNYSGHPYLSKHVNRYRWHDNRRWEYASLDQFEWRKLLDDPWSDDWANRDPMDYDSLIESGEAQQPRHTYAYTYTEHFYCSEWEIPSMNPAIFSYDEYGWLLGTRKKPDILMQGMQEAFLNACENFPKAADNNLSNMKDMIDMVIDIFSGGWGRMPKDFKDWCKHGGPQGLWMAWRYSISTTSSDTKQALQYTARKQIGYWKPQHYNGQATIPGSRYGVGDATVRVGFDVYQQTDDLLARVQHQLYTYGLEVTPYTLWDFVPFSFVADWFLPVGDRLEFNDTKRHIEADYDFNNVCWSLSYDRNTTVNVTTHHYTRWYEAPPSLDNYIWQPSPGCSSKTALKRFTDVGCMATSSKLLGG